MNTSITIILAVLGTVTSFLCVYVAWKLSCMSRKSDESEALRRRESVLILKNIDAVGTLAEKTALCVKNSNVNGDLEKALEYRTEQKHDLENYLIDVNAMKKCVTV